MYIVVIILKITIVALVSFLSLLFLICIIIPLEYSIYLKYKIKMELQIELCLLFKLLKIKFFIGSEHREIKFCNANNNLFTKQISKNKNIRSKKTNKKFYSNVRKYFNKKLLSCSFSYISEILRILKPSYIGIQGIYGFADPSVTGILCGLVPAVKEIIPSININLHPNFNDQIIDLYFKISGRIILSFIVFKTLNFIFKREVRKMLFLKFKLSE